MVSVHSAVSQDSVCSGSVEARQLMGFVYCKLFRLSKLKSVSGVGRSCLSVCGQIRAFKNGSCQAIGWQVSYKKNLRALQVSSIPRRIKGV